MRKIKVIDMKDAELDEQDGIVTHRLVTTKVGSPDVTFGISVMQAGIHAPEVTYPDHDEIIYIETGIVEFTIGDQTQTLGPGKTIFIPKGETYGLKIIEGPNKVFYVFSPAKN